MFCGFVMAKPPVILFLLSVWISIDPYVRLFVVLFVCMPILFRIWVYLVLFSLTKFQWSHVESSKIWMFPQTISMYSPLQVLHLLSPVSLWDVVMYILISGGKIYVNINTYKQQLTLCFILSPNTFYVYVILQDQVNFHHHLSWPVQDSKYIL